ncbi:hypothetical protein [Pseudokordiimonas caeni]|uniref:hypothetical protein n=1 Tax=Pseudokordiimonas caeni TaxID=2997908 RepID=UPI0028110B5C|nr:hypothetical protein [Pseudokordiimonas caeni]
MVLESLIGGALTRLAPEIIGLFRSKADREHEYRMAKLGYDAAERQVDMRMAELAVTERTSELHAMMEAIKAQGKRTGIWIADALSALVRPLVTYWWMLLYTAYKSATLIAAYRTEGSVVATLLGAWTEADMAILSSILAFWFVDRALRRQGNMR